MTEINLKIKTPSVPNFVSIESPSSGLRQDGWRDSPSLSIGELSDDQLNSLAESWRKELLEKARKLREVPIRG
jgi:hypothetical protein